jgi:diamine N-acetyltransferase
MSEALAWSLRSAGPEDAAALALIGAAAFLETYAGQLPAAAMIAHCAAHHTPKANLRLFEQGARGWLAEAASGGAPVGYALITEPDLPGARPGDIELLRIYALSRCHGMGLGKALLQAAIAGAAGHERLVLGVFGRNENALGFYRHHGFAEIGTREFNVGGLICQDYVLARPLNQMATRNV